MEFQYGLQIHGREISIFVNHWHRRSDFFEIDGMSNNPRISTELTCRLVLLTTHLLSPEEAEALLSQDQSFPM